MYLPIALSTLLVASVVVPGIATADPAKNKAVVQRFEDEFKNKANHAIVDELMAPSYKAHGFGPEPFDRAAIKQLGAGIASAFPDVHVTIESIVADGDLVVTRCRVTGTHKGAFHGVPATGKKINFTEMHMYRLADGKIVEQWSNVDFLTILTQIGALPAPK